MKGRRSVRSVTLERVHAFCRIVSDDLFLPRCFEYHYKAHDVVVGCFSQNGLCEAGSEEQNIGGGDACHVLFSLWPEELRERGDGLFVKVQCSR